VLAQLAAKSASQLTTAAPKTKKCWQILRPPRYKQKSAASAALFLNEQDNTTPRG
jgi:hypothetical protein